MSNKRINKKKATKQDPSDFSVEGLKNRLPENMSMKKGMKAVQGLPLATIGTVAAFAVTGFTIWRNREKIKGFFADVDLPTRLGSIGDSIAEKANSVSSMISGSSKSAEATGKKAGKQSGSSEYNDYN